MNVTRTMIAAMGTMAGYGALNRARHALNTRRRLRPVWWADAALIGVMLLLYVLEAPQRWREQRAYAAWNRDVDKLEARIRESGVSR